MHSEGTNTALTRPIVIDVMKVSPVQPPTVADADVVTVDALQGLYDAYRRGKRP